MARPPKIGLDYFPLDIDIDQDDKIQIILFEGGIEGFGIIIKLLMNIYKKGYYVEFTDKDKQLFAYRSGVSIEKINKILQVALDNGLFNKKLHQRYSIITSHGIQIRYVNCCERRKEIEIESKYCLLNQREMDEYRKIRLVQDDENISITDIINGRGMLTNSNNDRVNVDDNGVNAYNNQANVDDNEVNVYNNRVNVDDGTIKESINPQSKVKKSKEEERRYKEGKKRYSISGIDKVNISQQQYKELVDQYSQTLIDNKILDLENYIINGKGSKYKDHYKVLLNWLRRDQIRYEGTQKNLQGIQNNSNIKLPF